MSTYLRKIFQILKLKSNKNNFFIFQACHYTLHKNYCFLINSLIIIKNCILIVFKKTSKKYLKFIPD